MNGSGPGSFQIATSALRLKACEIFQELFESGVFITYSLLVLLPKSRWPSQLDDLGSYLPGKGPLVLGYPCGAQNPCS